MSEQVLEVILGAGMELAKIALTFVVGWIGVKLKEYIADKNNALRLREKEKYAKIAVEAVEMALHQFNSGEKFQGAKKAFIDLANDNNIPIHESEIDSLLESAVLTLKAEGKELKKIYDEQLDKPLGRD